MGPEMMDSCQEVLQSMGARLDFEPIYFSEVRTAAGGKITSESLNPRVFYRLQVLFIFSRSITELVNPLTR